MLHDVAILGQASHLLQPAHVHPAARATMIYIFYYLVTCACWFRPHLGRRVLHNSPWCNECAAAAVAISCFALSWLSLGCSMLQLLPQS